MPVRGIPTPTTIRRVRPAPDRPGISLVELLVVIAIIGTLASLLLPAVATQRETTRRTQCASRFRQVGIGLQAYHGVHSQLPPGHVGLVDRGFDGKSWGWGAFLLPFVEQQDLADQLKPTKRSLTFAAADPDRAQYLLTGVELYQCPSDQGDILSHPFRPLFVPFEIGDMLLWSYNPQNGLTASDLQPAHLLPPPGVPPGEQPPFGGGIQIGVSISRSNHVASIGSQWKPEREAWGETDFEGDGLFGRNSEVRHSEIADGTSKTLAVGERSDRNYAAVWAGANSWQGCGFADNQMVLGTAAYPINDAPISQNLDCDGRGSANFSSYHYGGANFLYADGSVHFVADRIDPLVYQALASRSDGENASDF